MTLRKIADPPQTCAHVEHEPPKLIVLDPGTWEHECPGCGHKTIFTVEEALWTLRYPEPDPLPPQRWDHPWPPWPREPPYYPPLKYTVTDSTREVCHGLS